ncbi:Similar to hypothetical protein [Podospora anserina S mat+]; acc. no. XP_001903708 [Pyronema omphalodes CBS 100304]|uniref:Uncharacterized protein n=1 Tax=Pyronema omphalodes (strain CBS 100304) TaxID=1076935 RepID=U4LGC0_PYROM|nr:Similar to hypothetical protein [Podospora anserina S mat+]; acc. no. XP_001903708 [Pyronema omphalodes CBS 100304]
MQKPLLTLFSLLLFVLSSSAFKLTICSGWHCLWPGINRVLQYPEILDNQCFHLGQKWNDKTVAYKVEDGCCAFYNHAGCHDRLFTARNREDMNLRDFHQRKITNVRCSDECLPEWESS